MLHCCLRKLVSKTCFKISSNCNPQIYEHLRILQNLTYIEYGGEIHWLYLMEESPRCELWKGPQTTWGNMTVLLSLSSWHFPHLDLSILQAAHLRVSRATTIRNAKSQPCCLSLFLSISKIKLANSVDPHCTKNRGKLMVWVWLSVDLRWRHGIGMPHKF